jgi:hypothetical protein
MTAHFSVTVASVEKNHSILIDAVRKPQQKKLLILAVHQWEASVPEPILGTADCHGIASAALHVPGKGRSTHHHQGIRRGH